MQEKEIWKEIPNTDGIYEASNIGRIKSLDCFVYFIRLGVKSKRFQKGRILKPSLNRKGYLSLVIKKDGNLLTQRSHRLVASAFIPNPENKPQVNHINGIKTDNRVKNLEWVTNRDNIIHAHSKGLINVTKGESHHNSKLTKQNVLRIRKIRLEIGLSYNELSQMFNVSIASIGNIINRYIWKHI